MVRVLAWVFTPAIPACWHRISVRLGCFQENPVLFHLPGCGKRTIGPAGQFCGRQIRISIQCGPHVCAVAGPQENAPLVGSMPFSEFGRIQHIFLPVPKHTCWNAEAAADKSVESST